MELIVQMSHKTKNHENYGCRQISLCPNNQCAIKHRHTNLTENITCAEHKSKVGTINNETNEY